MKMYMAEPEFVMQASASSCPDGLQTEEFCPKILRNSLGRRLSYTCSSIDGMMLSRISK